MKFPNSLIQSMTVSQRARLRTPLCLAALAAMLFAGAAWGQQGQLMTTLFVNQSFVPASSAEAYTDADITDDPVKTPLVSGTGPVAAAQDAALDSDLADIDSSGVGVVDWVLVQIRVVPINTDVQDIRSGPFPAGTAIATKAALLLSDGSISDPDAESLRDGIMTFGDINNFDSATQKIHVAIQHRNHLPVLAREAATETGDREYEYSFDAISKFFGTTGGAVMAGGRAAMIAGDVDRTGGVREADISENRNVPGASGYLDQNVIFTANIGPAQTGVIVLRSGADQQFVF